LILRAKLRSLIGGALLAVLAAGCGANVTLDPPTIPTPLIDKMPLSVALRIPEEFEHFVHHDEVLGREDWTIDLGRSNAALFTQLFGFMFEEVTVLGPTDDASVLAIDALVEPSIDAFEFSVPSQSKTDTYAVWIRYRIKVYDSAGDQFANWPMSAYGKSEQTGLTGVEPLKRAAVLAMRDAAALMIMKLDKSTGIMTLKDRPVSTGMPAALPEATTEPVAEEPAAEEPAAEEPEEKLPERREVLLPPPGPAAGPAVLSMDPEEDDESGAAPEGSDDE
jgi:hypothetical protein